MPDTEQKPRSEAQIYISALEDAIEEIADLVGVPHALAQLDTVRRRVKDIRTERDTAQARIKELEAERDAWKNDHEALRVRIIDLEKVIAHDVANSAARDMRIKELEGELEKLKKTLEAARSDTQTYASAEIRANNRAVKAEARIRELEGELLKVRAAKCLDEMDASPIVLNVDAETSTKLKETLSNLSSAGMVVTPNADPARAALYTIGEILGIYNRALMQGDCTPQIIAAVKGLQDEVSAVWELWGAGREVKPGALLEVCQEQEQHLSAAQGKLDVIAEKLDCAKVPAHYGRDQKGGPVPVPERVGLLIVSHASARALAESWETTANREAEERMEAHAVLDDLGSPAHAGLIFLDLPARILALPGLLRKD